MAKPALDFRNFEKKAAEAAVQLSAMGNARRLVVLCQLLEHGEMTVGDLAGAVSLSQSALSQHLGKMREAGLVTSRRESQTIWYRLADPRTEELLLAIDQLLPRASPYHADRPARR